VPQNPVVRALLVTLAGLGLVAAGAVRATGARAATAPTVNTWTCSTNDSAAGCTSTGLAPMPTARTRLAVVEGPDGKIYAIGGFNGSSLATVEAYDPTTNQWTCSIGDLNAGCTASTIPPMPTARDGLGAVVGVDQRIYAIGGYAGSASAVTGVVEAYDPTTNQWSCSVGDPSAGCSGSATILPMPTPRDTLAVVEGTNGLIYAVGGSIVNVSSTAPTSASDYLDVVEAYNPTTNVWTCSTDDQSHACPSGSLTLQPMPTARSLLAGAVAPDGTIYMMGGWAVQGSGTSTNPTLLANVEAYAAGTWTEAAPLPAARQGLAAAVDSYGRIEAVGGSDASAQASGSMWSYTPATNTWQGLASLPTKRTRLAAATGSDGRVYVLGGVVFPTTPDYYNLVEAYQPAGFWLYLPWTPNGG
jgi:hypothetical protein